jgi:hypothetical protein
LEAGIRYVCDWVNDDQPYLFEIGNPSLGVTALFGADQRNISASSLDHRHSLLRLFRLRRWFADRNR